jgi:hypothetical protein
MVKMKIELYTSANCVNCRKLKKILPKALSQNGMLIEDIIERDVADAAVLTDLMMLDTDIIPTLHIGGTILTGAATLNEEKLDAFLKESYKQ